MKKIILIIGIVIGVSIVTYAQHNKEHIKDIVYQFERDITPESIDIFLDSLVVNSIDSNRVCFISLFAYNNCDMGADEVFEVIKLTFLNDLVGKNVNVELLRERQPWLDEDFHMLHFIITHTENIEHLTLDINEGYIKNVSYWQENIITLSN